MLFKLKELFKKYEMNIILLKPITMTKSKYILPKNKDKNAK